MIVTQAPVGRTSAPRALRRTSKHGDPSNEDVALKLDRIADSLTEYRDELEGRRVVRGRESEQLLVEPRECEPPETSGEPGSPGPEQLGLGPAETVAP